MVKLKKRKWKYEISKWIGIDELSCFGYVYMDLYKLYYNKTQIDKWIWTKPNVRLLTEVEL